MNECPRFRLDRQDKFLDQLVINDHFWSVQSLLDFSFIPGINDALEGETRIDLFLGHNDSGSTLDNISNSSLDDDVAG